MSDIGRRPRARQGRGISQKQQVLLLGVVTVVPNLTLRTQVVTHHAQRDAGQRLGGRDDVVEVCRVAIENHDGDAQDQHSGQYQRRDLESQLRQLVVQ